MRIVAGNVWSQIDEFTDRELAWVDERTSVAVTRYRPGAWGKIKFDDRQWLLHALSRQFPTGLLPILLAANRAEGRPHTIEVIDKRGPAPCAPDPSADLAWLRDYQRAAVDALVHKGRGIIKAPTGSGKGEVIVGLTRALPCEWLMAVHRTDLVEQQAKRYATRTGLSAGRWLGSSWQRGEGNLTVATFQSLWAAIKERRSDVMELVEGVQGLIVDEVHAQAAETFLKVSMLMGNAYFRVGLSGTPLDRSEWDALRVQGALGPIVHEIRTDTLVDAGLLARPTIRMVPCVQHWPRDDFAEWGPVYKKLVVESVLRNNLLAETAVRAAKPALCFVEHRDHGDELAAQMRARGLKVDFVHGKHWTAARSGAVKKLVQGHFDVLICSIIFQEGIDIPELESVIVASGKASIVGTLQRIGRGMRTAKGKTGFEVYDVWDVGQKWLENHAKERRGAYEREGHEVTLG